MATPTLDPYDEFTYDNFSNPQTHVDRLGVLASLFGMKPAPAENCRVLELACGDASNLFPMAFGLPQSRFLGIDRAAKPLRKGKETIDALPLENLELRQIDLTNVTEKLGEFDYIIAHGLYSWVPSNVRDRIMEICQSSLASQGIAYISYNIYPGCRFREATRDMMLFHTRETTDPPERVAQGRALIKWLLDAQIKSSGYSVFLRETADSQAQTRDGAIYHDALAEVNDPVYFHQFMRHAAQYELQFLTEAEHFNVREYDFATEVITQLQTLAAQSVLAKEQYLDFLAGRSFRQTLLCHQEVELNRTLGAEPIRNFFISSPSRPASPEPDFRSTERQEFCAHRDSSMITNFPLAKAALVHLGKIYPQALGFDDLLVKAFRLLNPDSPQSKPQPDDERELAELLLKAYGVGIVEFHKHVPQFTAIPGERPLASPLARFQAQRGRISTSLLGHNVKIDDFLGLQFLLLLDGTRDRAALIRDFGEVITANLQPATDATADDKTRLLQELPERLEERLNGLGRRGFLLA